METSSDPHSAQTVLDLIRLHPRAINFFMERGTLCVGCYLAGFCSLEDVIDTYRFDRSLFYKELEQVISNSTKL